MIKRICAAAIALVITGTTGVFAEYKDASTAVNRAATDLNKRGILDDFISKYGKKKFFPTTKITREDLLLALYEYDMVIKTLMHYRTQLSNSVVRLKKRVAIIEKGPGADWGKNMSDEQIDPIVKEVQKRLPLLMNRAPVPKKINKRFAALDLRIDELGSGMSSGGGSTASMDKKKIRKLVEKEVRRILDRERSVSVAKGGAPGGSRLASKLAISLGMLAAIFLAR